MSKAITFPPPRQTGLALLVVPDEYLPQDTLRRFVELAEEDGQVPEAVMRELIERYVDDHERQPVTARK